MMKFISLFVFVGALWWTWHLTYSEPAVRFDTHASLQTEVQSIIMDYVNKHRPQATEIQFRKVWTETLNPNKVKVTFEYAFNDVVEESETTEQVFQGFAILNRVPAEGSTSEEETWSLDEVSADNTSIIFKKGAEVTQ
jgi:hypothetical protein